MQRRLRAKEFSKNSQKLDFLNENYAYTVHTWGSRSTKELTLPRFYILWVSNFDEFAVPIGSMRIFIYPVSTVLKQCNACDAL